MGAVSRPGPLADGWTVCEHTFVCAGGPEGGEGRRAPPARARDRARSHLRRARGARDQLPRGAGQVGAEQGPRHLPARSTGPSTPSGLHACLHLLLRPPDPHLPRPRRRPRLRARDRRQGERAGAARGRAAPAELEAGAGRLRDQHRSLPVGRGPLRADAADARGAARDRDAGIGAVEVAAAAARPRALPGARRGRRGQRQLLDPDAGGEGVARDRAAHAAPAQADGGGGGLQRGRASPRAS